jgi:hypothetical protein
MQTYPQAFGEALNATDMLVRGIAEVALIGNPVQATTRAMLETLRRPYRPNVIIALAREATDDSAKIPLLRNRQMRDQQATAYVCRHFACKMPVKQAEDLARLLQESGQPDM